MLILFGLATTASAQSTRSTAEALFQAGRVLFDEGKTDEACAKLGEAQRLEPAGGTLLLLGICHEKQGKTASAEAELRSALVLARRDRRHDREKLAQKHLDLVAGRAPMVLFVTTSTQPGVRVRIDDGEPLSSQVLGVEVPLDPGHHVVHVEADDHERAEISFDAPPRPETVRVTLPVLLRTRHAPKVLLPVNTEPSRRPMQTDAALVVGGVGVIAMAVGAVFGARAISLSSEAKSLCDPARCSDPRAFEANDSANVSANVSNVAIGVGVVAAVTAVVLYLTAHGPPSNVRLPSRLPSSWPLGRSLVVPF